MDLPEVRRLYTEEHLTTREIGELLGTHHVKVYRQLLKMGITAADGERVGVLCDNCGVKFWTYRARWRNTLKHYCSEQCYFTALHNPKFVASRQGTRIARGVVSRHYKMASGNVVHHVDSNETHNDIKNLWVFENTAAHMAFHRGRDVKPIWKGEWA